MWLPLLHSLPDGNAPFSWEIKVLPVDSSFQTCRNDLDEKISDSHGQALLLLADMNHYADCQNEDIILEL